MKLELLKIDVLKRKWKMERKVKELLETWAISHINIIFEPFREIGIGGETRVVLGVQRVIGCI